MATFEFKDGEANLTATELRRLPEYKSHTGNQTQLSTVVRHIRGGAIARNGQRVYLPAVRMPWGWLSSQRAVRWFFAQLNAGSPAPVAHARSAELNRVSDELQQLGVG